MVRRNGSNVFGFVASAASIAFALSCGGQSESSATDEQTGGACSYGDRVYQNGEGFPSGDGCNTCSCSDGEVFCTLVDCPPSGSCDQLSLAYQEVLADAKVCDPGAVVYYCGRVVASSIQCGCPTIVNSTFDLRKFDALTEEWSALGCGAGVVCGACPPGPAGGSCSADGVCVDYSPPD